MPYIRIGAHNIFFSDLNGFLSLSMSMSMSMRMSMAISIIAAVSLPTCQHCSYMSVTMSHVSLSCETSAWQGFGMEDMTAIVVGGAAT